MEIGSINEDNREVKVMKLSIDRGVVPVASVRPVGVGAVVVRLAAR